jgi:hypothetical protein
MKNKSTGIEKYLTTNQFTFFLKEAFMFNRNAIVFIFLVIFLVVGGCSQKVKVDVSYNLVNITDNNWFKGISTKENTFVGTGFMVSDSAQARSDFADGNKVTFSDGTVRTIVKQWAFGPNLIIFLDGTRLDGNLVGYPKPIMVAASRSK